jgi:hypothetical protein
MKPTYLPKLVSSILQTLWHLPLAGWMLMGLCNISVPAAHAQLPPLGVGPLEIDARVPRLGARLSGAFNVSNGGTQPMHVSAYLSDWTLDADGDLKLDKPGTSPLSCAPWIELNPKSFVLPGNATVLVRYTINTPTDLSKQHNAIVFFESRPVPLTGQANRKITISARMGAKVLVSPPQPLTAQAELSGITPGTAIGEEPVIDFANTSLRAVRVKGRVEALDASGAVVGKAELTPANVQVLAESQVKLRPQWETRPAPGSYTLRAVVDYGAKALLGVEAKIDLTAPAPPEAPPAEASSLDTDKVVADAAQHETTPAVQANSEVEDKKNSDSLPATVSEHSISTQKTVLEQSATPSGSGG